MKDVRIAQARRLMMDVTRDRLKDEKEIANKQKCKCGHMRKFHTDTYSINYTGGFCGKCFCKNYLER